MWEFSAPLACLSVSSWRPPDRWQDSSGLLSGLGFSVKGAGLFLSNRTAFLGRPAADLNPQWGVVNGSSDTGTRRVSAAMEPLSAPEPFCSPLLLEPLALTSGIPWEQTL